MFVFCFVVEMIFFIIYVFIEFGVLIMYILKDILYYLFINLYFGVNMINIMLINICRFFCVLKIIFFCGNFNLVNLLI